MQETIRIDVLLKLIEKIGIKQKSLKGIDIIVSRKQLIKEINKYQDIMNVNPLELQSTNKLIYEIVKELNLSYNIDEYKKNIKHIW